MSTTTNEPTQPEVIETPAEPVVAAEPVVPEVTPEPEPQFVYEYQPVDEHNRPLGAKQVFKANTQQELIDKIAEANKNLIKLNRELKKNIRLGKVDQDNVPEEVVRYSDEFEFNPEPLSAEDRIRISRDLVDPEKCDEATEILFQKTLGAKPDVIRENLKRNNEIIEQMQAQREAEAFMRSNKDYYPCMENYETITSWMIKNDLKPIRQNFQYAFETLKGFGLILEAPIVREEVPAEPTATVQSPVNTPPGPEPVSRITDTEPQTHSKRPAKVPTGLNRNTSSDDGTPVQKKALSLAEIDRMSSDEYKRRLKDPAFAKMVNDLYSKASQK